MAAAEAGGGTLRRQAIRGARWSVLDKWGVRLIGFATFAVLGYLLEPAAFGVVAAAQVVLTLAQTVTEQGVAQALILDDDEGRRSRSTAFWLALLYGTAGALALFLAAPLFAALLHVPAAEPVLRVLALFLILRSLAAVPEALAQRELRFRTLAVRSLVAAVVSGAVGVTLAVLGAGQWALVAQVLTYGLASAVLLWATTSFRPALQFSRAAASGFWRFGWKVTVMESLSVVVAQGDNIVVGALLGPVALGYYVIAFRLLNVVVDSFTGVMAVLALPVFAQLKGDRERTIAALVRASTSSLAVAVPAFGTLLVVAPVAVPLLFGDKWQPSVPILQILCVTGVVSAITYFHRSVLLSAGRPNLEIAVSAVMAAGTVAAAAIGAPFGLLAVTLAVAARRFVTLPLRFLALRAAIHIPWRAYVAPMAAPAIAGAALLAAAFLTSLALAPVAALPRLAVAALAGIAAYLAALWLLDRALVRGIVELLPFRQPVSPGVGT